MFFSDGRFSLILIYVAVTLMVAYRSKTAKAPWWFGWVVATLLINPLWIAIVLEVVIRCKKRAVGKQAHHAGNTMNNENPLAS